MSDRAHHSREDTIDEGRPYRPMAGTSAGCGCLGGLVVGAGVAASVTGSFTAVGSNAEWLLAVAIIGVGALVGARLAARFGERFWRWLWELVGWWP